jgi:quercetin dioxygenase-like cupin family protein
MKTLTFVAAALVALSTIAYLALGRGQSQSVASEVSRKIVERIDIAGGDEELRLMQIEYPPAYSAPPHRHPVAGLCYVIEGAAETQYEGGAAKVVSAGESFQDEANKAHAVFRNVSVTDPLRFLCAAKIRKDQPYLLP